MVTKAFINLENIFKGLSIIKQVKCTGEFYCWLSKSQQQEFLAQIIEDADDDVLIGELVRRGYEIKHPSDL